jgi:hypothetical protein
MTRIVAFTVAHDEPLFEPLWRRYYGQAGDVIIYDPRTTPGLPLELGDKAAERAQVAFVQAATRRLLESGYDVVMCPDIDEFLIPSNGQSLREFCETFEGEFVQAQGYQVVHQRNWEPPADFRDPLASRSHSHVSEAYTKVLLTKAPLVYGVGRHYAYRPGDEDDHEKRIKEVHPSLDLVHLKFVDFERDLECWNARADRCPAMDHFSREQFGSMYDLGREPVALWILWEGDPLPLKPHWRDALKLPPLLDDIKFRRDIPQLLVRLNAKRICEVGVRNGDHLRDLLVPSVREAVAVDLWQETGKRSENDECFTQDELDAQWANVAALDWRVTVDRCPSITASQHYPDGHFDFVYIDADHTESAVAADLRAWWTKVRRGGALAGHDFYDVRPTCKDGTVIEFGVVNAVLAFAGERGLVLHVDQDGGWYLEKRHNAQPVEVQLVAE